MQTASSRIELGVAVSISYDDKRAPVILCGWMLEEYYTSLKTPTMIISSLFTPFLSHKPLMQFSVYITHVSYFLLFESVNS